VHAKEVAERIPSPKAIRKGIDEEMVKEIQAWSAIDPKLRQINRLVELISTYNEAVNNAMEPIARYQASVNQFLSDSSKEIVFDASGNLRIQVSGEDKPRAVAALSSGERQVVVILTHLAFNPQARRANVLIIDEPELSLHVRWQELFVDAVLQASPGIQLILATHSPSIIGGRLDHCVDVEEARLHGRVLS
jgi:predicted ATP-binding protein involved in virulence